MKNRPGILAAFSALVLGSGCHAAVVAYFGSTTGVEVTDWRTTSTAKTMDIDGDNFYGTFGAVHWLVAGVNEHPMGSSLPGWAYAGGGPQAKGGGYVDIDDVSGYPANNDAGIVYGQPANFIFEMTGTVSTYAGMTVRVGVMADVLSSAEWAADQFKGFRIVQTVGGSGDSGVVSLRGGASGNGVPEMYFFDLTGVNPGDRFQILGLNNVGGTSGQAGYMGPVSWDLIPEPQSAILLLGALGLAARRRR